MKQLVFYVNEPTAFKTWAQSAHSKCKLVSTIDQVNNYEPGEIIALIQLKYPTTETPELENLLAKQYKIILFSNTPTNDEAIAWLQKGIKGYLNTFANSLRIKQAIDTVLSGNIWLGQSVMQALISQASTLPATNHGWQECVTEREKETLQLLLTGKTNQQIATEMTISERTVKSHISHLLEKFSVKDRLALVIYIQNWKDI